MIKSKCRDRNGEMNFQVHIDRDDCLRAQNGTKKKSHDDDNNDREKKREPL